MSTLPFETLTIPTRIINALETRDPIRISTPMLAYVLTYYHVMPIFLEYVFPTVYLDRWFKPEPDQVQDIYFSGLEEAHQLSAGHDSGVLEGPGRSGTKLKLCYNLRSVERTTSEPTIPDLHWVIKPIAVYHHFDTETGRALWITCKSTPDFGETIGSWLSAPEQSKLETKGARFLATLRTHIQFCMWAAEGWKWYLKEMETQVQDIAEVAQNSDIDAYEGPAQDVQSPVPNPTNHSEVMAHSRPASVHHNQPRVTPSPTRGSLCETPSNMSVREGHLPDSLPNGPEARAKSADDLQNHNHTITTGQPSTLGEPDSTAATTIPMPDVRSPHLRRVMQTTENLRSTSLPQVHSTTPLHTTLRSMTDPLSFRQIPPAAREAVLPGDKDPVAKIIPEVLPPEEPDAEGTAKRLFRFRDVQRAQSLEEKAQEALLVLRLNMEVLEDLKSQYEVVTSDPSFPVDLKQDCSAWTSWFSRSIDKIVKEFQRQVSRAEMVQKLLENRKNFVSRSYLAFVRASECPQLQIVTHAYIENFGFNNSTNLT